MEMLLLAEDSPGLPETEPAWAPGAASGCDSGPTLSLQGWDCHCVPARVGLSLCPCQDGTIRAQLSPAAGAVLPQSSAWPRRWPSTAPEPRVGWRAAWAARLRWCLVLCPWQGQPRGAGPAPLHPPGVAPAGTAQRGGSLPVTPPAQMLYKSCVPLLFFLHF